MAARAALGAELVIPALGAALAAYFFVSVRELAWEAKAMGLLVGALLAGLIAVQLGRMGRRVASGESLLSFDSLVKPGSLFQQRLAIVGVCALFIAVLPWLGVTLGIFLLSATLMLVLRAGRWRSIALASGAVAAGAWLLFVALLDTRMPHGPLERLLAALL